MLGSRRRASSGMIYNPLTRVFALGRDTDVNYMLHARHGRGA